MVQKNKTNDYSNLHMNVIRNIVAHIFFSGLLVAASGFSTAGYAQDSLARKADPIQVIARVSADSITLRWAPLTKDHWFSANQYGYTVQRFTLVRNGTCLKCDTCGGTTGCS